MTPQSPDPGLSVSNQEWRALYSVVFLTQGNKRYNLTHVNAFIPSDRIIVPYNETLLDYYWPLTVFFFTKEDVWIPVKFIRHPWYDDHWDIHRDSLLLGKTFTLITAYEDGLLGTSYRLLGLGLHEKFDQGLDLMTQWAASQDQTTVAREAVSDLLFSSLGH